VPRTARPAGRQCRTTAYPASRGGGSGAGAASSAEEAACIRSARSGGRRDVGWSSR
jgi:hypothetical protein